MEAREAALLALNDCRKQGNWSDGILKKHLAQAKLDRRDAALCTQLCFGVLQNQILLDFYLGYFSNIPLKRMESKVLECLRLGAYQMILLTKIPHSAAVDSSVELSRRYSKNKRVPGMVNAILRSLQRSLERLPTIPQEDEAVYLSTLYSHPEWLVKEFIPTLGAQETAQLLSANNSHPPTAVQVNTTRTTTAELMSQLEGVAVEAHPWLPDCLLLSRTGSLEELDAFQKGLFYVQDPASRLAVLALDPEPGMRVLDTCAAPGGKSFACAIRMENRGEVISCDLHPHKKKLIQAGAGRLGLETIRPMTADARTVREEWESAFDRVLVDAPCSGLGVIRKKPDIRYRDQAAVLDLPQVQREILDTAARYVKPGGVLVYSTCTLLKQENEDIISYFLNNHTDYALESFPLPLPAEGAEKGMLTLWPHRHGTDGFFIARLRRRT